MAGISRNINISHLKKRLAVNCGGGFVAFPARSALVLTVFRRNTHESAYEKNVEDELNTTNAPDEVIKPEFDKYWAPNPNTGVFGPESGAQPRGGAKSTSAAGWHSVLEEKAWFRPTSLEDLEKSP